MRTAFGVKEIEPRPVEWGGRRAWHCGDVLIRAVADNAIAAWSAGVLDSIEVPGVRIAKPVRSSDGRWVIAGWAASRFVPGTIEPRYDDVVTVAEKLHAATADLPRPRLLEGRDDLQSRSAAAAFGERRVIVDRDHGGALFDQLTAYREPVQVTPQVVHPELFGAVLFDGDATPAIVDLVPSWRPAAWAAAVVVVDALAWGGADEGLLKRWAHLPEWPQMLVRAVLHRIALHAQHPEGGPRTLAGLERAGGLVSALV